MSLKLFSLFTVIYFLSLSIDRTVWANVSLTDASSYETVRTDAHMFWWLFYAEDKVNYHKYPLIIWLQGGPGGSSTGFGNFEEIGPLDVNLKPRNTSWNKYANLLFIDNPVGTGYSYVSNSNAYARTNQQISKDLVVLLKNFLQKMPDFKTIPLYIFCESYGGKMTTGFAVELHQAIQNKEISVDFQGIALGDSWISPIDSVATWGPYLYSLSFIDDREKQILDKNTEQIRSAMERKEYSKATDLWGSTENLIESLTDGINFYNILQSNSDSKKSNLFMKSFSTFGSDYRSQIIKKKLAGVHQDDLSTLMNGYVKKLLNIPSSVTWGGQSTQVFNALYGDFMLPVVDQIDYLLNNTNIKVVVYTGQLDLIVDTIGTLKWMNSLKWPGIKTFDNTPKKWIINEHGTPVASSKSYKNLSLYWIMKAGHMVPADAGDTALKMVKQIVGSH